MTHCLESMIYAPVKLYSTEVKFIEEKVMGTFFPWYYIENQTFNESKNYLEESIRQFISYTNPPYLSHILLPRSEDESITNLNRSAKDFSGYYEFFIEIFHRFLADNNQSYSKIYRANLNLTWHNGIGHSEPHVDHSWKHKNFIMYLNSCQGGETIVWPDDFSTSYMIPCQQYHAVSFDAQWHAHRFPEQGNRRVVFVVTYI